MRIHAVYLAIVLLRRMCTVDVTPIVDGQFVTTVGVAPKYPYIVSLQDRLLNEEYRHFCGGSLLNSRWILTAAHCIWRKQKDQIVAVIGHENISFIQEADRYEIEREEFLYFQPTNYQNDIALLRLKNEFQCRGNVGCLGVFAKVPEYGMKANRKKPCKIIGYGATHSGGDIQNNLIEGEVNVIVRVQCRKILGHIWAPRSGENTVCALGNQDTCQGDSGGPLICTYNDQDYIYGIVSYGFTCGVNVPSIYTVTIPYLEWMRFVITS